MMSKTGSLFDIYLKFFKAYWKEDIVTEKNTLWMGES